MTEQAPSSFLGQPKSIEHEVNGELLRFYPLSVAELYRIKELAKPIAKALAVLMADNDQTDRGRTWRELKEPDGGLGGSETIWSPVNVEVARFRSEERQSASASLIDAITSKDNGRGIARAILDSLRREVTDSAADALYKTLDIVTLKQVLVGMGKANADIFAGPLGARLQSAMAPVSETTTAGAESKTS